MDSLNGKAATSTLLAVTVIMVTWLPMEVNAGGADVQATVQLPCRSLSWMCTAYFVLLWHSYWADVTT